MQTQILSVDWSKSKDSTVISSVCANCGHILETNEYDPEINGCAMTAFKTCPYCGVNFNKHCVVE